MLKQIMIPAAAFAVTVTGVSAFNPDLLEKINVDLSDTQVSALEEAHELQKSGADREDVKEILEEGGVDQEVLKEIKTAGKELQQENKEAIAEVVEDNDYEAFLEVAPEKLTDVIDSEEAFELFVEAAELREDGDHEGAAVIMSELGLEKDNQGGKHGKHEGHEGYEGGERGDRADRGERPEGEAGERDGRGHGPRGDRDGQ